MATPSLATLLVQESKEKIYSFALSIAQRVGLPVSSWQPGDPTRSLYHLESELLAKLEEIVARFIAAGFLDYATGVWLKILAKQVFNVDVPEATYASTTVVLTNTGGGLYDGIRPGDLTFKNTATGKTYHNTTGGDLLSGPGTTLSVTVEADEAGSDSSAGAGEIDDIVSGPLGVTCTNPTAAIGLDEQDEETTRQQCRAKLDTLSPNGMAGAYEYVAITPALAGTSACTRARSFGSSTGDVTLYCAGPSGAIAEPDRVLIETAILKLSTPLCVTPAVLAATEVVVPVTYDFWVYKSANLTAAEHASTILSALSDMFARRRIGGDIIQPAPTGALYKSLIESTIRATSAQAFRATVSSPAADVPLLNSDVAVLGAVTANIHIVEDR